MIFSNFKERLSENSIDCEIIFCDDGEEVNKESTDLNFESWPTIEFVQNNLCVISHAGGVACSIDENNRLHFGGIVGVDIDSAIEI